MLVNTLLISRHGEGLAYQLIRNFGFLLGYLFVLCLVIRLQYSATPTPTLLSHWALSAAGGGIKTDAGGLLQTGITSAGLIGPNRWNTDVRSVEIVVCK